jgi:hypothetical protein
MSDRVRRQLTHTGLCLGGPYDGQRMPSSGQKWVMVPEPRPMITSTPAGSISRVVNFRYQEFLLRTPDHDVAFWVPEDADPADIILMLASGYRKPRDRG